MLTLCSYLVFFRSQIGTLHVGPNHQVKLSQSDLYIPLNFHVYLGGYLGLPTQAKLYNLDCSVNGTLGGVQDLAMVASSLTLDDMARSSGVNTNGLFLFQKLNLLSRAQVAMTGKDKYVFSSREINLGPGSQISACQLSMEADKITVAEGAIVDLSAACNMASGKGNLSLIHLPLLHTSYISYLFLSSLFLSACMGMNTCAFKRINN